MQNSARDKEGAGNAALPATLPPNLTLLPRGSAVVIVSMAGFDQEIRYTTVTSWLGEWKEIGANLLVLWPVWEHIPPRETISARTSKGQVELRLDRYIHHWNPKSYLKPDPDRGSETEFLEMIRSAHAMGFKVLPVLQVGYTVPGSFVYEKHPEWILKAADGGSAACWPWGSAPWGYVLNKADPGLIKYVTETVLPHWVKAWGVDGMWLDAPPLRYCDPRIKKMLEPIKPTTQASECLTPVDGFYSAEPLAKALRATIGKLEKETRRRLVCAGEHSIASYSDLPDEYIEAFGRGETPGLLQRLPNDRRVVGRLGKYWDWVCDYRFRGILKSIYDRGALSYSERFVNALQDEPNLQNKDTEPARFVNQVNSFFQYDSLLNPAVAECYITLAFTAPGRVVWFEGPEVTLLPQRGLLSAWYKRLAHVKKALPALQSNHIEDALLDPKAPQLIAFNRWKGKESATVIVNAGEESLSPRIKTRFGQERLGLFDLLHAERIAGDPANLTVEMPARSARVIVREGP